MWLFSNEIQMEHTSDLVYEGRLIHETSYVQRSQKYEEVEIDGIKVDFYDTRNKVIHEIKKSDKIALADEWQLKYYLYVFERNGITDVTGILEYPTLRKTDHIMLSSIDRGMIEEMEDDIRRIINSDECPVVERKELCKKCSYYDFCFSGEKEE